MESAFGIDHGEEVSKLGIGGLGTKIGQKTMKIGQGLRQSGANNMAMGRKAGGGFGAGMQVGGAKRVQAGGQLRKLGQGMQKRPGLTGGLAVGGGAAGVGAAGGMFANRQRRF
jgi:hypothetical protein